ncbi:MAG: hypothetical protein UR39_C0008G0022 [Candidatus Woesebacteria bacterium GW2011_GWA1_33_30]|uniref:Prokaryotic glutathione synthetase ATP-binding domain-containing protein n=1 Tax=Candidatus Woesebacteria bacterium GW2011_GWA2_33_28 TaxID=1618561 RepID=A0A0G0C6B4_9BACT|nr:MAG: hypothetical protein UR38_C0008G0021 [Candidatus Woesebacteria bacterium GW2011_GWA2_33_28]KKP47577.1 MAG: hypothetical protein UR39_C0008G0022 [Candidatus Woesebacteria bacterium GW2011_GWA1_33_30]KKP49198.1 MAG: hypothetical protein UR40_C0009G0021 [Microgenomates group bacterium GW2011_GWC1_33_32]KKP51690.1 MAG: hypothetical protein UR44_C0007G0021 [Candidatus Woesebacteria bacterium GW2011_GWB1_33_38]KKP58471.1 MAG: hypothetical protein UR48_C0004G0009 [Microgenomates group bacteriu
MSAEKISLLTYAESPNLADGEKLLPTAFEKSGLVAEPTPWDGDVNWEDYSTIILRACWNYHLKRDDFLSWLESQEATGKKILNPLNVVKWNTDKHYLLDLESRGVNIIPTQILEPSDKQSLVSVLETRNWKTGVVKPVVGASAYKVQRFDLASASSVEKQLQRNEPLLVQRFCPEINEVGEYSLMFFGGVFSHAVLKKPKSDDFRTQPHFGGSEWLVEADGKIIEQTSSILAKIDSPLLYAQVDGVVVNGAFQLMELELVEPYLFLDLVPKAPQDFVKAYKKLTD